MTKRLRVAVVMPHPVHPADSGDRVRTAQLIRQLTACDVDPTLVHFSWDDTSPDEASVRIPGRPASRAFWLAWRAGLAVRRWSDPHAVVRGKDQRRHLQAALETGRFDVIDFQHSFMFVPTSVPAVVTFHNVDTDRLRQGGARPRVLRTVALREREVTEQADLVVVLSDTDANRVRSLFGLESERLRVVPLGFDPEGAPSAKRVVSPDMRTAIFVGSFDYEPNVEAARLLLSQWSDLRRATPLRELLLVGRQAEKFFKDGDGVAVHGSVPSVMPYLARADVHLMPILRGGGVRVKAIESFAVGVPVVATPLALDGLGVEAGKHAMVAEVGEFVRAIASLTPLSQRAQMAREAQALWRSKFSASAMASGMADAYRSARLRWGHAEAGGARPEPG